MASPRSTSVRRLATAVLVAALTVGGVTGCGDDGGGSEGAASSNSTSSNSSSSTAPDAPLDPHGGGTTTSTTAPPEHRRAFIAAATAVCDASAQRLGVSSAQLTPESTEQQVAAYLEQFYLPEMRDRLDQLAALDRPAEDAAVITELLDDSRAILDLLAQEPEQAAGAGNPWFNIDPAWDGLGLSACGSRR